MRILLLGPHTRLLEKALENHELLRTESPISSESLKEHSIDLAISFGFQHIISPPVLDQFEGRAFNIHISLLPWNRGRDPNFWSWLENTPKGVSIHQIVAGVDTGPLVAQEETEMGKCETLKTSYQSLMNTAVHLFSRLSERLLAWEYETTPQQGQVTSHRRQQLAQYLHLLDRGWDTSCSKIENYGRENGLWVRRA